MTDPGGATDRAAGTQGRWERFGRGVVRITLGPWPFFPWVVFTITFVFLFLQNMQVSIMGRYESCRFVCIDVPKQFAPAILSQYGDEGLDPFDPVLVVGNALLTTLVIVAILWGFGRVLRKDPEGCPSRGGYLLAMITASVAGGVTRIYILSPVLFSSTDVIPSGLVPNTLRTFLSITILQSISGMLTMRYARQAAVANAALATVVQQQRLVVEADERARRNVAEFLHDRVQADLLVVAMELRAASFEADPQLAERLDSAITSLERIRSSEVRSASRRLSPAFGSVGLDTALQDLADSWNSVIRVQISVDAAARALLITGEPSRDLLTAVYRLTEQALLNAASHGHASRVDVALSMASPHSLLLTVSDDGRGMGGGAIVKGAGSAIIDAWCAVARGSWAWVPAPRGVRLEAIFAV